jgi:hypothetical protein
MFERLTVRAFGSQLASDRVSLRPEGDRLN